MKANQKSRENSGVTAVLGTLLMLPIMLTLVTFMMFWAQDLITQIKHFQNKLNEMVDDINVVVKHLYEESFIIWNDGFEGTNLQWEHTGAIELSNQEYFNGIKSCKLTANLGTLNTISKEFPWGNWEDDDLICIDLRFTVDPIGDEDYKIFKISQKLKNTAQLKNIGEIKIDIDPDPTIDEADISYIDQDGVEQVIMEEVPMYASDNCWHHMTLFVDFDEQGGQPEYLSFLIDGSKHTFYNQPLYNTQTFNSNTIEYILVEYSICSDTSAASSYIDDFSIRYSPQE